MADFVAVPEKLLFECLSIFLIKKAARLAINYPIHSDCADEILRLKSRRGEFRSRDRDIDNAVSFTDLAVAVLENAAYGLNETIPT